MNADSLRFCTYFARCVFDMLCPVGKMDEAMCNADDHGILSHEVELYNGLRQILHNDKLFCKIGCPISNLSLVDAIDFSNWRRL